MSFAAMSISDVESNKEVMRLINAALAEDGAGNDVTSLSLVDPEVDVSADIIARKPYRVAGGAVAGAVFRAVDASLSVEIVVRDGVDADAEGTVLRVSGSAKSILSAERTALNFMQRMTGIASAAKDFADVVRGCKCVILDTRKTVPGFRFLDKYSVACGGAVNHRMGLHDMALIKDNHRKLWRSGDKSRLDMAVAAVRKAFPDVPVEVEVESFEELESALAGNPDWIMLDNMPLDQMRKAVKITGGRCRLEASGGIDREKLRAVAETGVDAISLGCLTHSVKAADLSLEIVSL